MVLPYLPLVYVNNSKLHQMKNTTTGGGGLPSPVPTTPGETIAAGAGATRPGGGNILPADTESGSGLTSKPINVINLNAAQCCFQPDQIIVLL